MGFGLGAIVQEFLDPIFDAVQEAFEYQIDVDQPGNLRSTIHQEVASALAEVAASTVDFAPRGKLFQRMNFAAAETEILIQSISLSQKWQMTQILEELFEKRPGLRVRILLMHPYSPHVGLREADLTFNPGTIRQLIDETVLPLSSLRNSMHLEDRLQVRGYSTIPYYGISCVDRNRLTIALSRERRGGDQNLGIYVEASSQAASGMIADILAGFDARWDCSPSIVDYLDVAFSPGSERRATEKRLQFEILSREPLNIQSLRIHSTSSTGIQVHVLQSDENRAVISAEPLWRDRPQHFTLDQALGQSGSWLRGAVEIPLPAFDRLGSLVTPEFGLEQPS